MRVLVVGSGAREHAIVRGLQRDPAVADIICAPGNAGIAADVDVVRLDVRDTAAIVDLALGSQSDLVVIGPEAPLVAGAADAIRGAGIACFGPSAAAAQLEGSKAFAKQIMTAARVPTASAEVCDDLASVAAALTRFGAPHVVKDDGLAAGKGVLVTSDHAAALDHARHCLSKDAGRVLVEEFLDGPEVSLFVLTDGEHAVPLLPAQDFKRLSDGDHGPNTGGMGAYAPLDWLPPGTVDEVMGTIAQPTIDAMRARGTPFVGVLYVGLSLTSRGTRVVEFNARFGDPETQCVLALLKTGLGQLLFAAATGELADAGPLAWEPGAGVTVVLAAPGYPEAPQTGGPIHGLDAAASVPGASVLHAGTRRSADGGLRTAGGRVLSVVGTGSSLRAAHDAAYLAISRVSIEGGQFRTDIAARALAGEVTVGGGR